jgi:hypothetical protein
MRITPRASALIAGLILAAALNCLAQAQKGDQSADSLRSGIEQLEQTDLKSKSPLVQGIYKRSLFRLYNQYASELQQDIAELKSIQTAMNGAGAASQTETTKQLDRLAKELTVTEEKLTTLKGDLNVAASADAEAPELKAPAALAQESTEVVKVSNTGESRTRTTSVRAANPGAPLPAEVASGGPAPAAESSAPSKKPAAAEVNTADPPVSETVVSGTVFVTNKYFYEEPATVTVDRLQGLRLASRASANRQLQFTPLQSEQIERARSESAPAVRKEYQDKKNLDRPLANVEVKVEKLNETGGKSPVRTTTTGSLGGYQVSLPHGEYIISVNTENFSASEPVFVPEPAAGSTPDPIRQDLQIIVKPLGEFSRAIVGFEQAGASSAKSVQKYFFDLTISAPLPFQKRIDPYFGARGRGWGSIRVTSVPQQISTPVGTFATGFATQVSNVKVNEVAQAVEFLAGAEYRLIKGGTLPFPFSSFDNSTTNKFVVSLIAGGGATTPLNPRDTLEVFKVSPAAVSLFPQAAGKDFIAFVSPDRDRFFRQYYAGLRLQTYYFNSRNDDIPLTRFPAMLDITFGQNEAVTGGRVRGGILRLEGYYPLPYEGLKFINLFGTAMMKLTRTKITDPLILEPAPTGTTVTGQNVAIITVPQINRDYYRIGVGIDFVSFVKALGAGQKK